jgi:hypothetical protein
VLRECAAASPGGLCPATDAVRHSADRLRARSLRRREAGLPGLSGRSTPLCQRFRAAPYARPTYSEGGYAYADSYPYSDDPYGYGAGLPGYAAPAYDPPGPGYYQGLYVRPAGVPPYTAYRYRVAPSAKIIHLPPRD